MREKERGRRRERERRRELNHDFKKERNSIVVRRRGRGKLGWSFEGVIEVSKGRTVGKL